MYAIRSYYDHALGAGREKAGALAHHVVEDLWVDVLEMDVIDAVPVAAQGLYRIHPGIGHMAGGEAEPSGFGSYVANQPVITSYSIHYTKLYDQRRGGKADRLHQSYDPGRPQHRDDFLQHVAQDRLPDAVLGP